MRAIRCHELIGPAGLRVDEVPEPTPDASEVLIDVRAAGVNFPDVLMSYGKYQFRPAPPFVPGGEAAGVVKAVGSAVTSLKPGDRVGEMMIRMAPLGSWRDPLRRNDYEQAASFRPGQLEGKIVMVGSRKAVHNAEHGAATQIVKLLHLAAQLRDLRRQQLVRKIVGHGDRLLLVTAYRHRPEAARFHRLEAADIFGQRRGSVPAVVWRRSGAVRDRTAIHLLRHR